ncbi:MAG: dihydroneopterin aldolase [Bacteroidales bacterium]|nr:dihydroneopterin aldolase [Bacteroidales bacterium]
MNKNSVIELKGLKFHSYHGCLPDERIVGADYEVNLTCVVDLRKAAATDDLKHTVDYSVLYNIVKDAMQTPVNLLEKVAGTILKNVRYYAPKVKSATVTICKMQPPFDYSPAALDTGHTAACVTMSF